MKIVSECRKKFKFLAVIAAVLHISALVVVVTSEHQYKFHGAAESSKRFISSHFNLSRFFVAATADLNNNNMRYMLFGDNL